MLLFGLKMLRSLCHLHSLFSCLIGTESTKHKTWFSRIKINKEITPCDRRKRGWLFGILCRDDLLLHQLSSVIVESLICLLLSVCTCSWTRTALFLHWTGSWMVLQPALVCLVRRVLLRLEFLLQVCVGCELFAFLWNSSQNMQTPCELLFM